MQQDSPTIRYHSLDALRAMAMLLGIVLHAAWFMTAQHTYTPISDVDGGYAYDYVLQTIHLFRLQVFFVMAGFFANLVFSKRGPWRFIRHRTARIAVPLAIGWFLLYPIMMLQCTSGGMMSGRILSDQGLLETFRNQVSTEILINPSNFYHLWFLYNLLIVYAVTLFALFIFRRVIDRRGAIRRQMHQLFRWSVRSRAGLFLLAVPSAVLLYFEPVWWGIFGIPIWFIPHWAGFLGYLLFFGFGWMLFAQADLLQAFNQRWKLHLTLGMAMSIPILAVIVYTDKHSGPLYPFLSAGAIGDHNRLVNTSIRSDSDGTSDPRQRVWQFLSPKYREFLYDHEALTSDQKTGLAMEINFQVVFNREFSDPTNWSRIEMPGGARSMFADRPPAGYLWRNATFNRRLLEFAVPEMIAPDFMERPYARILKAGFSIGYGVAMWLLVFGLIGCFNRLFRHASPVSRYIADSAYWIYLVHLPILMQIELSIATSRWGLFGVPKFLFYIVMATVLCFVTYHYLVRSTFIGRVLNGRSYPFVPWFGKKGKS